MARSSRLTTALLLCGLALLTGGCAFFGGQQANTAPRPTQTVLVPGTPAPPAPSGWFSVLSGWRLTDETAASSLVASFAQPGRVAGCALPAGRELAGKPYFALSNDAGRTWHLSLIPGAPDGNQCVVLADARQPDTFAVNLLVSSSPNLTYLTTDAGHTWQTLHADSTHYIELYGRSVQLVDGHLFAVLAPHSGGTWQFAERDPDGTWQALDASLPYAHVGTGSSVYTQPPQAYAVDPDDPARIYAVMPSGSTGMTLYGTHDDGATWHTLYSWGTSSRMALWTGESGTVFAQDLRDHGTANQFFYSPDGGATWIGSGLHHQGGTGADAIFPSAIGRVVTLADQLIFNLDPATGVFSVLAHDPVFTANLYGSFTCAAVEGSRPTLLCGDEYSTYGMPLPVRR